MAGFDCSQGLFKTNLSTNRFLVICSSTCLFIVALFIASYASNLLLSGVILQIYLSARWIGKAIAGVSALVACHGVIKFAGAVTRRRSFIKYASVSLFFVLVVQFILLTFLWSTQDPDQLAVAGEEEFLTGFESIVERINNGEDEDGRLTAFVTEVESEGKCCGYDSVTDKKQNPETLNCEFDIPCKDYLQTYIGDWILTNLHTKYMALCILEVVILFLQTVIIVKIDPKPLYQEETGWTYYTFNPV